MTSQMQGFSGKISSHLVRCDSHSESMGNWPPELCDDVVQTARLPDGCCDGLVAEGPEHARD